VLNTVDGGGAAIKKNINRKKYIPTLNTVGGGGAVIKLK
jgi:hypothetical protein